MRYRVAISLCSILIGLLLVNFLPAPGLSAAGIVMNPNGYQDLPFKYTPTVQTPTGEKPQSKLWYNDGRWWGDLFNNTDGKYHIYWLDLRQASPTWQQWIDTGTVLDPRPQTKADCLWDGTHLYVVSGGGADPSGSGTTTALPAWIYRFSYNSTAKVYSLDFEPVTIRNGGAETIVLDKDTTGMLWITYTQDNKVYVNHSRTSDADWNPNAALLLQVPGTNTNVSPDDISSLVAFDNKIGVIWSNESAGQFSGSNDTAFYFAVHADGAPDTSWTGGVALRQPSVADDHINLKSLQADTSGNIFAMVKTSLNTAGSAQLLLLVAKKQPSGLYTWSTHVESLREDAQTRPILLIDTDHRTLYVFTSNEGGGEVHYKSTSIDTIQFAPGPGSVFMSKAGFAINDATSTKQTVNATSGIVVLASHNNQGQVDLPTVDYYFHNYIDLSNDGPTVTPKPKTPTTTPMPTIIPTPIATPTRGPGQVPTARVYLSIVIR
jgi:hypothetical protein